MNENRLFLPEGSLTLLAERAGIGQRALAVTIAQNLQKQYPQRQVLYFSLEMARQYMYCCHRIPSNSKLCVIDHLFHLEDIRSIAQLICNYDKYDDLSNYRVDRITDIRILDERAKPIERVLGEKERLQLADHMAEHIYMFAGKSVPVKFRANRYIINDIIDYFGLDAKFSDVTDDDMTVTVKVNEEDMFKWAVQYGDHAVVLKPHSLHNRVREAMKQAVRMYEEPINQDTSTD